MLDTVYGHETTKKALVLLAKKAKFRYHLKYYSYGEGYEDRLPETMKMFISGESGTGKTLLINTLAKEFDFPVVRLSATSLVPTGAKDGIDAKQMQKMVMKEANFKAETCPQKFPNWKHAIDQTVIFIDEMDKLGLKFESSGNWNSQIQASLLTLMDKESNLNGCSWIFSGSFSHFREAQEKDSTSIGFHDQQKSIFSNQLDDEDLIAAGLIPELVGRLNMLCALDTFTREDYRKILLDYVLPEKQAELKLMQLAFSLTDEQVDTILNVRSKQGVRSMIRELNKLTLEKEYEQLVQRHF